MNDVKVFDDSAQCTSPGASKQPRTEDLLFHFLLPLPIGHWRIPVNDSLLKARGASVAFLHLKYIAFLTVAMTLRRI